MPLTGSVVPYKNWYQGYCSGIAFDYNRNPEMMALNEFSVLFLLLNEGVLLVSPVVRNKRIILTNRLDAEMKYLISGLKHRNVTSPEEPVCSRSYSCKMAEWPHLGP